MSCMSCNIDDTLYNFKNNKSKYCKSCKDIINSCLGDDMSDDNIVSGDNILEKKCMYCNINTINKNYCSLNCYSINHKNDKKLIEYNIKSNYIIEDLNILLNKNNINITNKYIGELYVHYLIQFNHVNIILELYDNDDGQRDYNMVSEELRIQDFYSNLNFNPIVFINFNFGKYKKNEINYNSMFIISKKDKVITKNNKTKKTLKIYNDRLLYLYEYIEKYKNMYLTDEVIIEFLYF